MPRQPLVRWQWADLPEAAQAAVTSRFGAVLDVESAPAGLTPGIAASLATDTCRVFLKAAPLRSPAIGHYERERAANQSLPGEIDAPALLWSDEITGWLVLAFEHVTGARPVDLGPRSVDVGRVVEAVARTHELLHPCPWKDAPNITQRIDAMRGLLPPDADRALAGLADRLDPEALAGDTLLHTDIHEGNLLATHDAVHLVDWSLACHGAPWVEVAWLVPRLIAAGHSPAHAETIARDIPTWSTAPPEIVTALAALRALAASHLASNGPVQHRDSRRRLAAACLAWVRHRQQAARAPHQA